MINRIVIVSVLAFVGFFAYGQGAHAFAPNECPCDSLVVGGESGISGREILDMICPGGELAEGGDFIFNQNEVSVSSEDPFKIYTVRADTNGPSFFSCSIGYDDIFLKPIRLRPDDYELCRLNVINSCVAARPIPTLSEWGLVAMAGLIGIIGFFAIRKRVSVS